VSIRASCAREQGIGHAVSARPAGGIQGAGQIEETRMPNLLRIDASPRRAGSQSRLLGDHAEAAWRAAHPGGTVVRRDLAAAPLPHVSEATIGAFFTPPGALSADQQVAIALSDQLVDELLAADTLLVTTPMYNFGIPSALKSWIDHIMRVGRSFSYDGTSFAGLAGGRDAILTLAYGAAGYGEGGPFAAADFALPHLRFLLGFIGIAEVQAFAVEGTSGPAEGSAASFARARDAIDTAFAKVRSAA